MVAHFASHRVGKWVGGPSRGRLFRRQRRERSRLFHYLPSFLTVLRCMDVLVHGQGCNLTYIDIQK